jgi:DNA-binding winged helix-turn-helix (wHTH) protein
MTDSAAPAPTASPPGFGPFVLDVGNARLTRDGALAELRPKAFELLAALAARPGQLLSKDELLDSVWRRRFITEGVIKLLASELRVALDDDPKAPRRIETVARGGYRFCGSLQPLPGVAITADAAPAAPPLPPPHAGAAVPPPLLPGRESALQTLQTLQTVWQCAATGQRCAVLIGGDTGVGRSTLAAALAAGVPTAALAHGACVEGYGPSEPYGPWLQALAALAAQDPALPALLRQVAPNWLAQLPWLQDDGDASRASAPERMPREMAVLLERLSAQCPLLVWLEDLHWADHASVQLLDLLVRQRSAAWVLLPGTVRTLDAAITGHPMADARREWRLHGLVQDRVLAGLEEAGVVALATARHPGAEWPAAAVHALQRHTEGLPLFVLAVLDALVESGVLVETGPGHCQPLPLRDSVGGLFEKQLAALAPAQRELLEAAAVAGLEFDAGVLAEALGTEAAPMGRAFDGLLCGLWQRLPQLPHVPHLRPMPHGSRERPAQAVAAALGHLPLLVPQAGQQCLAVVEVVASAADDVFEAATQRAAAGRRRQLEHIGAFGAGGRTFHRGLRERSCSSFGRRIAVCAPGVPASSAHGPVSVGPACPCTA